jgi:hypothetical protein
VAPSLLKERNPGLGLLILEDEGSTILRNARNHSPKIIKCVLSLLILYIKSFHPALSVFISLFWCLGDVDQLYISKAIMSAAVLMLG